MPKTLAPRSHVDAATVSGGGSSSSSTIEVGHVAAAFMGYGESLRLADALPICLYPCAFAAPRLCFAPSAIVHAVRTFMSHPFEKL
ncbi:hypothetical protein V9T40_003744 [Parthenolecanium corni]|uniref:Uncharacterized protein n=1 Tax=Parthenolecanium corni TaxID=536013 RepID=A0AAN9TVW5_9HEMI